MTTITAELQDKALVLPSEVLETLGWRQSDKISIEKDNGKIFLRPSELTADDIADLACVYLIDHVGDATAVKKPTWKNGKWSVEVGLSYKPETIGFLTFSVDGHLIASESDSPAKLKGFEA